jgi:rhodanese-related sulfurtransferase
MKYIIAFLFSVMITGCQQKPTTALEESADIFEAHTVLIDTRSALDFQSFHIKGSSNLLVEDFLILKNPVAKPKNQKRIFDSNLINVIERLATRGINPTKKIYLMGASKDSIENKKWLWLLNNLEITEVSLHSVDQIRKIKNGKFAEITAASPWTLKSNLDFQKEFILNKAQVCFADTYSKASLWNAGYCR